MLQRLYWSRRRPTRWTLFVDYWSVHSAPPHLPFSNEVLQAMYSCAVTIQSTTLKGTPLDSQLPFDGDELEHELDLFTTPFFVQIAQHALAYL